MSSEISPELSEFLEQRVFVDGQDLILTVKNSDMSVNIDGPFMLEEFEIKGKKFRVVQPVWAKRRGKSKETNVHMHLNLSWSDWVMYCRIQYRGVTENVAPFDRKISFYAQKPSANQDGGELFWFYAQSSHPLVKKHASDGKGLPPKYGPAIELNKPVSS